MRFAVCFLYILAQVVYLMPMMPGNRYTYAFNIITHVAMAGYLAGILSVVEGLSENERLMFQYIKFLSIANCIYIAVCAVKNTSFAIYNTPLFAHILGIGFVSFVVHCALKK